MKSGNDVCLDLKIGFLIINKNKKLSFENYNELNTRQNQTYDILPGDDRSKSIDDNASRRSGRSFYSNASVCTPMTNMRSTLSYKSAGVVRNPKRA